LSAAWSWSARLDGKSSVELVSMVMTTKPFDARRGPSQLMLDWVPVNPGEMATPPKVPWLVSVG
jgi:hypothetical protein